MPRELLPAHPATVFAPLRSCLVELPNVAVELVRCRTGVLRIGGCAQALLDRGMTIGSSPPLNAQAARDGERHGAADVIRKILVIVDPLALAHPCVEKAGRLALAFGSSVELFICDIEQGVPDSWAGGKAMQEYRAITQERRIGQLERLAAPLRARGVEVMTDSQRQVPFEEGIIEHSLRSKPALVVKDTQRRPRMRHAPVVQTDWILIRQVAAPLLLVRSKAWPAHPLICVAVDPCRPEDRPLAQEEAMVAWAGWCSRRLTGKVELVHALRSPPHSPGDPLSASARQAADAHDRAAVERLAHRGGIAPGAVHCLPGALPDGLARLAESACPDILVMGAAGQARLPNSAASTAAMVLEQVTCDLLVVKAPGFVSPARLAGD
jgi:universal stress protein E